MFASLFADRLLLTLLALPMAAALGGPLSFWRATGIASLAGMFPRFVRHLERKLNRAHRSAPQRRFRGMLLLLFLLLGAAALGGLLAWLTRALHFPPLALLALVILLPVRPPADRALATARALSARDLPAARRAWEGSAWRHAAVLDEHGLARASVETLAHAFGVKILPSLFWYLLLGLPGLTASAAARVLGEMLHEPDDPFGWAAGRAHHWLHYLPARLAALLLLLAAPFVPGGRPWAGVRLILRDPEKWRAAPARWPLAAAAGTLSLSLAGPASPFAPGAWLESGPARAVPRDIRRCLFLYLVALLLLWLALALLSV